VQAALQEIVALKLVPKQNDHHKEIGELYSLQGYPTLLYLDSDGTELDRFIGFRPARQFLEELGRVRAGDTFAACIDRLDRNPGHLEDLQRAARGLLERGDTLAALTRIDAFLAASSVLETDPTEGLYVMALGAQHSALYRRAERLYRDEWPELPDVTAARATPALVALLGNGLLDMDREEQALELRQALHADAAELLAAMPEHGLGADELFEAAEFACTTGHYAAGAGLFARWSEAAGDDADSGRLNSAAWTLYLCRSGLDLAVDMARSAYAVDADPDIADTVARLLYVTGEVQEAMAFAERAAAGSEGSAAEQYTGVLEQMRQGAELEDRPDFEEYPRA